ncbi:hypothetical protein PG997_002727 [Apiospora hydei]|uniref:Uncharacterized protein n=1 Tax=Apiospora hydei TaxID=1337664 RepID=A0ABR1WX93_9PEZI
MKIAHLVWLAGTCGRLAAAADDQAEDDAGLNTQGLVSVPKPDWPSNFIRICNGANFTQECGRVDMSEKYIGKCKTIPYGLFYGKVMSAELNVSYPGGCCELFDHVNCIGSRVLFQPRIHDLYGHCGFGGGNQTQTNSTSPANSTQPADSKKRPANLSGKTKSFACYKPEECLKLTLAYNGTDCYSMRLPGFLLILSNEYAEQYGCQYTVSYSLDSAMGVTNPFQTNSNAAYAKSFPGDRLEFAEKQVQNPPPKFQMDFNHTLKPWDLKKTCAPLAHPNGPEVPDEWWCAPASAKNALWNTGGLQGSPGLPQTTGVQHHPGAFAHVFEHERNGGEDHAKADMHGGGFSLGVGGGDGAPSAGVHAEYQHTDTHDEVRMVRKYEYCCGESLGEIGITHRRRQ